MVDLIQAFFENKKSVQEHHQVQPVEPARPTLNEPEYAEVAGPLEFT